MRVDDGAEFGRHFEAGHQRRRDVGRHREDDGVVGAERDGLAAEIERFDPLGAKAQRAQLMLQAHRGAALLQMGQRRLDQRRAQTLARNQRPAGAPAGGERLADDRAGKPRRALRRIDIERREQQRLDQPAIQHSVAGDDLADRFARPAPREAAPAADNRARACPARAGRIEHPERQPAVVEAQRPALAAREIDEREFRGRRTDQPMPRRRCCADNRARRGCRTAKDDCRCRSSCRPTAS